MLGYRVLWRMQLLHPPNSPPVANYSSIAIGIAGCCITNDKSQKHVALIYRNDLQLPWLLHLGWHRILCHEPWSGHDKYHWVELSSVDIELQETFADWAALVANAATDATIPYSVVFSPYKNFGANGQYINRKDGSGLTCATFLLAIFDDFGLPLVEISTWPHLRKEDSQWLKKILKSLGMYIWKHVPSELPFFWEQFRQRYDLKRFRPEEVLASAHLYVDVPLRFEEIDPVAKILVAQVPK